MQKLKFYCTECQFYWLYTHRTVQCPSYSSWKIPGLINCHYSYTQKTMSVCVDVSHITPKHHEFLLLFLIPIRCVVDSVVSLLPQLDGEEAVTAHMECHAPHDEFNLPKKKQAPAPRRFLANI